MDILQKKLLGWGGFALMVIAGIFLIVKTNQEYNTAATTNTVSFSGQGKVSAKPDIGLIDLSITTEAATSKAAQDANTKKSNAVIAYLKKQGIDDKDVKTTGYNIYPQYDYSNGQSNLRGYQVNQSIQVKVRDLDAMDDVLSGVVGAGANQVNSVQLTIDDPEKIREAARQKAIDDAKTKAAALEDQLGISLGHIVNFSEGSGDFTMPAPVYLKDMAYGRGGGGGGPEMPTGQNDVVISVTITYQIR